MIDKDDPRLTAFVLGELDPEQRAELQAAIDESPKLKRTIAEIRETVELLSAEYRSEAPVGMTPSQRQDVLDAMTVTKKSASAHRRPALGRRFRFAVAASVLVALALGTLLWMEFGDGSRKIADQASVDNRPRPIHKDGKYAEALPSLVVPDELEIASENSESPYAIDSNLRSPEELAGEKARHGWRIERLEAIGADQDFANNHSIPGTIFDGEGEFRGYQGFYGDADGSVAPYPANLSLIGEPLSEHEPLDESFGYSGRRFGGSPSGRAPVFFFENLSTDSGIVGPVIGDYESATRLVLRGSEKEIEVVKGMIENLGDGQQRFDTRTKVESAMNLVRNLVLESDPTGKLGQDGENEFRLERRKLNKLKKELEDHFAELVQPDSEKTAQRAPEAVLEELLNHISERGEQGEGVNEFWKDRVVARVKAEIARQKKANEPKRTWKRVKAIPNTSRLMVGDKDELDMQGMQVNVRVDGFRARVLIDCFYYNDRNRQLEGTFKLRLPDDASLYYVAFGQSAYEFDPKGELARQEFFGPGDGRQFVSLKPADIKRDRHDAWRNVKEARMVPREKAAFAYGQTVRKRVDPALVEWSGAGVFNARVFPLMPHKLHRIVIGYDVNLTATDDGWTYRLDLPEQTGQCRVDLTVTQLPGAALQINPESEPVDLGENGLRFEFRDPTQKTIQLTSTGCQTILLRDRDADRGDFWATRITPELDKEEMVGSPRAVFLVDTSLSSQPDKFNVWLKLLEQTLDRNRDSLREFAVVFFNIENYCWREQYVENTPENVEKLMEHCNALALEGATDLYGAIKRVANTDWLTSDKGGAPDLFLLSDGAANWGERNVRLMEAELSNANVGSLFAYQTGLTGTEISSLRFLAGGTGGAVFSVTSEDEVNRAATAHRRRPWELVEIEVDGGTDVLTAGRVHWVYPGQELTIVGRGAATGNIRLQLRQGSRQKAVTVSPNAEIESDLASRLYGHITVGQLESLGPTVRDIAAAYARHFRITGQTCSLLMLETEADYQRFNIQPEEDLFVIKTKGADKLIAKTLQQEAEKLGDPKARFLAWVAKLEKIPGMQFRMPTALRLALDEIEFVAVSDSIRCRSRAGGESSQAYRDALVAGGLDYDSIVAESQRRASKSSDDALKVLSNLVEQKPGDLRLARDVAFSAMQLNRPASAYHLLKKVAQARPFEASIYPALGQCLTQLEQADMAIVFYEIALEAAFQDSGEDFRKIVAAHYRSLLRRITNGKIESSIADYARARLETLEKEADVPSADLLVAMMWNTDQTDVDLHVVEPSGEECFYKHRDTKSGGRLTKDVTTGFGPEMFVLPRAPKGDYEIKAQYYGNNQNRTKLRTKVYLTIYHDFGTDNESITRKTVALKNVGEKQRVETVTIK